jgi:hypothetical protein
VARYFESLHHLYSYLDDQPQRARYVFAALVNEKGEDGSEPLVSEDEEPLVNGVLASMEAIATRLDAQQERGASLAEEADLLFNPFPARITVRVPGDVLASQGFPTEGDLVIERVDLLSVVAELEGRWVSPDPLSLLLRDTTPTAAGMASLPRHAASVVSPGEIADAIRERMVRPRSYVVRFRD